jgi:hypothetical protein
LCSPPCRPRALQRPSRSCPDRAPGLAGPLGLAPPRTRRRRCPPDWVADRVPQRTATAPGDLRSCRGTGAAWRRVTSKPGAGFSEPRGVLARTGRGSAFRERTRERPPGDLLGCDLSTGRAFAPPRPPPPPPPPQADPRARPASWGGGIRRSRRTGVAAWLFTQRS